jgi:hypothetical protein
MSDAGRVRLRGGPEGSASWAYATEAGDLVVECYDYGKEANAHFGTDVAFLVTVAAADKARVFARLGGEGTVTDAVLLDLIAARFASYFDARRWLDDERIPYRHDFDSWA